MVKIWQHPAIGSAAVHCLPGTAASAVSSGPQLQTDCIHVISWAVKNKYKQLNISDTILLTWPHMKKYQFLNYFSH